jgi:hypothetical protein
MMIEREGPIPGVSFVTAGRHAGCSTTSVTVRLSHRAFRNVGQRVCASRFGAGSIPFSFRMWAMVPQPR